MRSGLRTHLPLLIVLVSTCGSWSAGEANAESEPPLQAKSDTTDGADSELETAFTHDPEEIAATLDQQLLLTEMLGEAGPLLDIDFVETTELPDSITSPGHPRPAVSFSEPEDVFDRQTPFRSTGQPWFWSDEDWAAEASSRWTRIGLEEAREYAWDQAGLWITRLEFGGTVHDGVKQERGLNVNGLFERKFDRTSFQFETTGRYLIAEEEVVTNRWLVDSTVDIGKVFDEGNKWIVFVNASSLHDEIKRIAWRGSVSTGFGYRFIDEKQKRLIVRFGPGFTRQHLRDPFERTWQTELYGEVEFRHPLNKRVNFEHKSRVTPIFDDVFAFTSYRVRSEAAVLIDIDERKRWQLKLGVRANYDSTPREDQFLDYTGFMTIVYTRRGRK